MDTRILSPLLAVVVRVSFHLTSWWPQEGRGRQRSGGQSAEGDWRAKKRRSERGGSHPIAVQHMQEQQAVK